MQRTWTWVATGIAGAYSLWLLPGVAFILIFPERMPLVGVLAWLGAWFTIGAGIWTRPHPRAGPLFVAGHALLPVAAWLMADLEIHWLLLAPPLTSLAAAIAAWAEVPWA